MAGENKQAVNAAKPSSSQNRTEQALKPKAKIEKKSAENNHTNITKAIGMPQTRGKKNKKKKKKRIVSGDNRGNSEKQDAEKLKSIEVKKKGIATKERNVNNQQIIKPEGKLGSLQKEQQNQKKNEERRVLDLEKHKSQMNKGKRADTQKNLPKEKKKEKLGGLIFMCSAKTKPDCFRYRVMGVSISKKELVLGIKPGIMLFLYDFDLRLLYGVYKASSSGGLKLEPTAFDGAFPVQVRFTVHQDCYPLPECVFKKAIKENYNESNKFDTELSVKQVKKLVELFRPAVPKAPVISPQPVVAIQSREPHARDHQKYEEVGRYSLLPIEDNLHLSKTEVPSREREEFRQDTFLSEKEYRAYGLRRERPNPPPPIHVAHVVEPYARAHVTDDGLRHPPAVYSDMSAPRREATRRQDELSLNGREYQTYGIGARLELQQSVLPVTSTAGSMHDSYSNYYYPRYGSLAVDPYQPPTRTDDVTSGSSYLGAIERRETYPIETDPLLRREAYVTDSSDPSRRRASYLTEYDSLRRRENDDGGRTYATSASRPLFDYNQTRNYQEPRPEPSQTPVSSRYSFAGPSTLYR